MYLGVRISPVIKQVVSLNYDPLVDRVREMLNRRALMPISMIGHINIIKMLILEKLLYIFQALPLPLPETFFYNISELLNKFIWHNKKARLQLRLLCLPYEKGGLQLPSFQRCYWAAQLRLTMYYFSEAPSPAWVNIEQASIFGLPLKLYLYSNTVKKLIRQTKNPFLRSSIRVWHSAHQHVGDTPVLL